MDLRFIAFGMVIVLVLLFVGAKLYIPREKSKMKWEAEYALAAREFFKEPSPVNYKRCKLALEELMGSESPKVMARLKKDRIQLSS